MSLSTNLLHHALELLGTSPATSLPAADEVDFRRAISASYYALFHCLSEAVVEQIAPQAHPRAADRIYRWLDHGEMKRVCEKFALAKLTPPLRDLLGDTASSEMRTIAFNFVRLQEARHSADYDRAYRVSSTDAFDLVSSAIIAVRAWEKIAKSAEANVFVLSLLLWKNWEKRA